MAVKVADTIEAMGNFPAMMGKSVSLVKESGAEKSLQKMYEDGELGGGGTDFQWTEVPEASEDYDGKVIQYVGTESEDYIYGRFYACLSVDEEYAWREVKMNDCDVTLSEDITANVTVGGVDSGTTIPAKTSFEALFNNILVKYINPSVTLKLSVASLRAKWNPISSVTLTTTTTKGTSDITEIELKAGSTVIETQASAGTFEYVADISANTTFSATVKDIKGKTASATASVGFVVPYYYGVSTATGIADPTTLTEDISSKGNKTYKYTVNEQYIYIAYDYSYGALTSILDSSGFENKGNFTDLGKVTVSKNGTEYDFRVYRTSSVQTQTNFPLTFKF